MKKLLLPFFCMSCVSAISAQNIPEDADTLSIGLKEVKVMASYGHDKGVEPVVLSTISAKDIATKLSNQEFPEIMKSTPSIYATKQGGGFGDSRLMLRGFGSENIAVLINGESASASEVLTGALKDYNWVTVVGTTSYGKGIVQSLMPLGDGSAIKITVSHYYTPSGFDLHGKGIEPDVVVELDEELKTQAVVKPEEDNQVQRAVEVVKDEIGAGNPG